MPPPPPPRIAYIRTIHSPTQSFDETWRFLAYHMSQRRPSDPSSLPRHHFIFGSTTPCDAHILNIFTSPHIFPSPHPHGDFANIQPSDLQLRISESHAATGAGKRILQRCADAGISTLISGMDDAECDASMLQEADYIIDKWIQGCSSSWYWDVARPGVKQDNIATNPRYDMSKHDVSKTRLRDRYAGHAWTATSGGMHGNGGIYACTGCGRRCKRGKCQIGPLEDLKVPEWCRLPGGTSAEWRDISADDACERMWCQRLPRYSGFIDSYSSIDTFSGE